MPPAFEARRGVGEQLALQRDASGDVGCAQQHIGMAAKGAGGGAGRIEEDAVDERVRAPRGSVGLDDVRP